MQGQHLFQLLFGVIEWMDPSDAVAKAIQNGKCESELLDGCRALLSVVTVTSPIIFDQLLKSIRPYSTLNLLSVLMGEVIKDLMANFTEEETCSWVARDILVDDFVDAMDERLSSYALIALAAMDVTVPLLSRLFSDHFTKLHKVRGVSDPTETLEELYSLLLITGRVLADEGQGKTPLVPLAIHTQFVDVTEPENHPVVVLSGSIINFSEQSKDAEMRASFFSPRLMEAVIWFLARWTGTFLMPPQESKGNCNTLDNYTEAQQELDQSKKMLLRFFGEHDKGKYVLNVIVCIATAALVSYPFEKNLQL